MSGDHQHHHHSVDNMFQDESRRPWQTALAVEAQGFADDGQQSWAAWASGWRYGMVLSGQPYADITPDYRIEVDGRVTITYGWQSNVDAFMEATLAGECYDQPHDAWLNAHEVFLLVDKLRPHFISPSIMLVELQENENIQRLLRSLMGAEIGNGN